MFATVSRARAVHPQRERDSGPSEEQRSRGVDSCYGVKSLMSDWDDGEVETGDKDSGLAVTTELVGSEDSGFTPTVSRRQLDEVDVAGGEAPSGPPATHYTSRESMSTSEVVTPAEDYTPLSFASLSSHAQSHDLISEPSSPASFTSMPTSSYLSASISSLSRSSSPTGSSFDLTHRTSGRGYPRTHASSSLAQSALHHSGHDASLVLPTMSLPDSSLHISISPLPTPRPRLTMPEDGLLTIILVGAQAHTSRLVRELVEEPRIKIYDLQLASSTREIGVFEAAAGLGLGSIVEDDEESLKMLARLRILNVEQDGHPLVQSVVSEAFQPLHRLLHPDPSVGSPADQQLLLTLVEKWAGNQRHKSDDGFGAWLDLAVFAAGDSLSENDDRLLDSLSLTLPTMISTSGIISTPALPLFTLPKVEGTGQLPVESSTQSSAAWSDPTPRGDSRHEGDGYFSSRPETPLSSTEDSSSQVTASRLVDLLLSNESTKKDLHRASATSFLTWRQRPSRSTSPTHDLSSSEMTATSLESGNDAPIPTLARASGGGEWEAGLSRRVAARRQSEMRRGKSFRAHHAHHRGLDLFPRGVPSAQGATKLSSLISSIFLPLGWFARSFGPAGDDDDDEGLPRKRGPGWSRFWVTACAVGMVLCVGAGVSYWGVR